MKRILVLGGGFAGLSAIHTLKKQQDTEITLIDHHERFVFTPWLIDALAGTRHPIDISEPYEVLAKRIGFTFIRGEVLSINRETMQVEYSIENKNETIPYDELVLGLGAKTNYYHIPGAHTESLPLKVLSDVQTIHDHIRLICKKAIATADTRTRQELLSFIVIGAGPTGVETSFALKQFVMTTLGDQWHRLGAYTHFYLVQGAPTILPGFNTHAINLATDELRRQGFELILGEPVDKLEPNTLYTTRGTIIHSGTMIWCAGIEPQPITIEPELAKDRGGFIGSADLRLADHMVGAGDIVRVLLGTAPAPKTGQIAIPMGQAAAEELLWQKHKPFRYLIKGSILLLGNTGLFDLTFAKIKTPFAKWVRAFLYIIRFKQLTHG